MWRYLRLRSINGKTQFAPVWNGLVSWSERVLLNLSLFFRKFFMAMA
jgi:hypothetical protein